eukprot:CAMPEP_0114662882 /NCGR_PEP_ID=MMETSP0191-20121206/25773_1 /TAXON_ID=126664 /ORGANISM="Sorites sp." /LENGTH=459 /DNA_ID=CAMNT_0001900511 /DNA_START=856 /DNA_END=2232 /DNA_ORIENTATION=+
MDEIEFKNQELMEQLDQKSNALHELHDNITSKDEIILNLNENMQAKLDEITSLNISFEELKLESKTLKSNNKQKDDQISELNERLIENEGLKNQINELNDRITVLNENNIELQDKLAKQSANVVSLEEKMNSNDDLLSKYNDAKKQIEILNKQIQAKDDIIKNKDNEIDKLKNENKQLNSNMEDLVAKMVGGQNDLSRNTSGAYSEMGGFPTTIGGIVTPQHDNAPDMVDDDEVIYMENIDDDNGDDIDALKEMNDNITPNQDNKTDVNVTNVTDESMNVNDKIRAVADLPMTLIDSTHNEMNDNNNDTVSKLPTYDQVMGTQETFSETEFKELPSTITNATSINDEIDNSNIISSNNNDNNNNKISTEAQEFARLDTKVIESEVSRGELIIKLLRATGVPEADMGVSKDDKCDPYLRVYGTGADLQSKVIKKTTSPEWNETLPPLPVDKFVPVVFELW